MPGGLKTAAQAAAKLNCSIKTLKGHVAAGELRYVSIGPPRRPPMTHKRLERMLDVAFTLARRDNCRVTWKPVTGELTYEPLPHSTGSKLDAAAPDSSPQADDKSVDDDGEIVL
jgi:hypothetical protein